MSIAYYFSEEDLGAIEQEVKQSEKEISGEIVPVFVERSHHYPETIWRAAVFGMVLTGLILLGIDALMGWKELFFISSHIIYLVSICGGGLVFAVLAVTSPQLKRLLVSPDTMQEQVTEKAYRAFLDFELFSTRQRTGILIFVSLFEHRVQIIGDKGINAKVSQQEWDHIVAEILPLLKKHNNTEALIKAVRLAKELLLKHGFTAGPEDQNELPDHLREIDTK